MLFVEGEVCIICIFVFVVMEWGILISILSFGVVKMLFVIVV